MEIGSVRDGYLAKLDDYPDDEEKIFVMRGRGNDELAPSEELLSDYKELEEKHGNRWEAWNRCRYEPRFREEMKREKSRERIEKIAEEVASGKRVRLICYEKNRPCHRFILKQLIGEEVTKILVAPFEEGITS
ncbi:hypothetical protein AKJ38_02265 [candidate division MSBL1 archaeon SCGC-AAA259I14]|uniref:DUF488 domain-containing protein n=1 Tax=candidate division MSBL1 archaeon SCGC-AAA259I14 TaxID=1698268 RepID=A0A133US22_9EURY|nr:hypothetical protein AKJ38_02265 [candidate division MSBL1 archaeon SCGC-AAA259I14]